MTASELARSGVPVTYPEAMTKHLQGSTSPSGSRNIVLVVEDDEGDRVLIEEAFEECGASVELHFARNGDEARDFLFRFGGRARAPRPALILLDLNLPGVDGRAVLRDVREDPVLRPTPIIVLTGSDDRKDVIRAYDAGANSYFRKPDSTDGYRKVVRILESYWLRRVELPDRA